MNRKIFRILLLLMTIALTGTILTQILWIQNAVEVKNDLFDRAVNDALSDAVKRIEVMKTVYMMTADKKNDDSLKNSNCVTGISAININDSNRVLVIKSDSGICRTDSETYRISVNDHSDGKMEMVKIFRHDRVKTSEASFSLGVEECETDSLRIVIQGIIDDKDKKFNIILSDIMNELDNKDIPLKKRIDFLKLKKITDESLKERNIDIPYLIGVLNNERFINIDSTVFDPEDDDVYKIKLFPDNVLESNEMLCVLFPEKNSYILKNISWLLASSVIFTLIILIVFYLSILMILKQKKLSEIKSDFINNMTHEFKTPIATISLAADSIENPMVLNDKDQILNYTKIIKEENRRMNSQVENILQMALADRKDLNLELANTDIHEIIKKAVRDIQLQISKRNGKLELYSEAENSFVMVDEMHFYHVIYNLLDNACKYSDKDPDIKVRTYNSANSVHIVVQDNGIGMSKEVQNRIFEKFYRVPTGNIHNIKGHGLGLSYVKLITGLFNGKINVNSEQGKGSSFEISIPNSL